MISILMPLFNGVEFFNDSIKSIFDQTYTDWELLIGVNGHGAIEATQIFNKLKKYNDLRVKYSFFSFKSKTLTLNKLAAKAKYNYICTLDVDDYWEKNKLEKQLKLITKYDIVGTNCEYFGTRDGSPAIFLGKLSPAMFSYQNPMINSSIMLKKEDAHWDIEWEGLDDYNLWIDLLNKNKTFYNIPECLTKHRVHKRSFFNQNNNDELAKKLKLEKMIKLTDEDYIKLYDIMDNKKWEL